MKLTDIKCKKAASKDKPYKLADGRGMYLEVTPNGGKYWRQKYRFHGREKRLALGVYPEVGLKEARERCSELRKLLAKGVDPSAVRQAEKANLSTENSFEAIAREWHARQRHLWTEGHAVLIMRRFEANVFPWLKNQPIHTIIAPELLRVLRRIESRGAIETSHRVHACCGQVFRYAIATGRADRDISQDLKGAIPPVKKQHHPSITEPEAIGSLLRAIEAYEGSFITKCALKFAPLTFVRPGELRRAEWSEINFDEAEWRIPAEKMKARVQHIVPLSRQAVAILEELHPLTAKGAASRYLFPSVRTLSRPMSVNTVNGALRRMGYERDEMTGHGFRSMASTLLNEQGWKPDAIERQLAHSERNNVRAAYNYAEYLPERRKMMQAWADYLDALAKKITVIKNKFGNAA